MIIKLIDFIKELLESDDPDNSFYLALYDSKNKERRIDGAILKQHDIFLTKYYNYEVIDFYPFSDTCNILIVELNVPIETIKKTEIIDDTPRVDSNKKDTPRVSSNKKTSLKAGEKINGRHTGAENSKENPKVSRRVKKI